VTGMRDNSNVIVDTLRIADRELHRVLVFLAMRDKSLQAMPKSSAGGGKPAPLAVPNHPRMLVRICHQADNCTTYLVKPREMQSSGISFLHGAFVHNGARCAVLLRTSKGKPVQLDAGVINCSHVTGRIHEIAVKFDAPIRMDDYQFASGPPVMHDASDASAA